MNIPLFPITLELALALVDDDNDSRGGSGRKAEGLMSLVNDCMVGGWWLRYMYQLIIFDSTRLDLT